MQPDLLNRYFSYKQPKWISLPLRFEISSSDGVKSLVCNGALDLMLVVELIFALHEAFLYG